MWTKNNRSKFVISFTILISFIIPYTIIVLIPFNINNKIYFAFIFSLLTTLISIKFNCGISKEIKVKFFKKKYIFIVFYILNLIILIIWTFSSVPYNSKLSLSNFYLYLPIFFSTNLLTVFLPGYLVISMINFKKGLNRSERVLCSILISILVTTLSGYIAWLTGLFEFINSIIIGINIIILFLYILSSNKNNHLRESKPLNVDLMLFSIIFIIFIFLISSFYLIHNDTTLPLLGDEFDHLGILNKIKYNRFSWQEIQLKYTNYPYFFHFFQLVISSISKIHIIDSFLLSSGYLICLPTIAFYILAKKLAKNKNQVVLATIFFQIFSGFGWILAFNNFNESLNQIGQIYTASVQTNDIIFSLWLPVANAPFLIDLTIFLFCLNLIFNNNLSVKKMIYLFTFLFSLMILFHLINAVIFVIISLLMSMFQIFSSKKSLRMKEAGIGMIISIVIVLLIDLSSPYRFFTSKLEIISILFICSSFSFLMILLSILKSKQKKSRGISSKYRNTIIILLVILTLVISLYEIIMDIPSGSHASFIPLYFLPLKLGFSGLFCIFWIISLIKGNIHRNSNLKLLFNSIFALQIGLYHLPIISNNFSFFDEFRFIRDILWPVIAIIAGIGLYNWLKQNQRIQLNLKMNKLNSLRFLTSSLIIAIVMGMAPISHLLKLEYNSYIAGTDEKNNEIILFLENLDIYHSESIYAPIKLKDSINSVTGVPVYTRFSNIFGTIVTNQQDLSSQIYILNYLNIRYIIQLVNIIPDQLSDILNFFPIIYTDDYYRIFKVPDLSFSSMSLNSESIVVNNSINGEQDVNRIKDVEILLALSKVRYSVSNYLSYDNLIDKNIENIILTESANLSDIHTILTNLSKTKNVYYFGDFEKDKSWLTTYVDLDYINETVNIDSICFKDSILSISNISIQIVKSVNITPSSWYCSSHMIPLVLSIPINSNKNLTYINIWPLVDTVRDKNTNYELYSFYEVISFLFIQNLDLKTGLPINREFYQKSKGLIKAEGNMRIELIDSSFIDTIQNETKFFEEALADLVGEIEITPKAYGYCHLKIRGELLLSINNFTLSYNSSQILSINCGSIYIHGEGKILYSSLTSDFPYILNLNNENYNQIGVFDFHIIPISTDYLFLIPNLDSDMDIYIQPDKFGFIFSISSFLALNFIVLFVLYIFKKKIWR